MNQLSPEKLDELRDIIREMLTFIDLPTDVVNEMDSEELIKLGERVSVKCERKRMEDGNPEDPDDNPADWLYLELVEGDITETCPFNPNELPEGRKWHETAAEAFNDIIDHVISGKQVFRFRQNKNTGDIIQVMFG